MKHIIFKRNEDGTLGEKMGSYEGPKDDTSANRSYLQAEPMACHLELPEGMDEDCVDPTNIEGILLLVENEDKVLAKRQAKANTILSQIRVMREPLLEDADHSINAIEDDAGDASALKAWRKALRECTNDLKKVSGDAKLSCENMIAAEFEFPTKPE
jgi:hypothetical protein